MLSRASKLFSSKGDKSTNKYVQEHKWTPNDRKMVTVEQDSCGCEAFLKPGQTLDMICSCSIGFFDEIKPWINWSGQVVDGRRLDKERLQEEKHQDFAKNMIANAHGYIQLLELIDQCEELTRPAVVDNSIDRLSKYLTAKASAPWLVPPFDVMCCLASLLVRPYQYIEFCSDTENLVDHPDLVIVDREGQLVWAEDEHLSSL